MGQAIGSSQRYQGDNQFGTVAWLYDGTNTVDIGFADSEHTTPGGFRRSTPRHLNQSGQVIGESRRYNGTNFEFGE